MEKNRSFSRLIALLMMILLLVSTASAAEPKTYEIDPETEIYRLCHSLSGKLNARQVLVYDPDADEILYAKSVPGGKLYPASTTKLFSTYVALQHMSPEDIITAGDELNLVRPGSSMAYIYHGQSVRVETAVQAMMMPSGNDAAMILAAAAGRRIAGDESLSPEEAVRVFVTEMNRQAAELGFEKSHFINPDGYHMGAHYTCLADMARMASLALGNETISAYMGLAEADVTYASGQTNHWKNSNRFLHPDSDWYREDVIGMKTGHTNPAGYSIMTAFRWGRQTLVIGVFGCTSEAARLRDVVTLADACEEIFD